MVGRAACAACGARDDNCRGLPCAVDCGCRRGQAYLQARRAKAHALGGVPGNVGIGETVPGRHLSGTAGDSGLTTGLRNCGHGALDACREPTHLMPEGARAVDNHDSIIGFSSVQLPSNFRESSESGLIEGCLFALHSGCRCRCR